MNTLSFVLSLTALLLAGLLVYYQYFFKQKVTRDSKLLAVLRFVSILSVLMLLINPKFEKKVVDVSKPKLLLAVDNSASISYTASTDVIKSIKEQFLDDADLKDRFDLSVFQFGSGLSTDTLLNFKDQQTNIYNVVEQLDVLAQAQNAAIVIPTDGHQTFGRNYAYLKTNNTVFPVVIGDTIENEDISISRINVNAYATLKNNFPVEIFLNSSITKNVRSRLLVERSGKELYSTQILFSPEEGAKHVTFYLPADSIGMQLYKARLIPFKDEKEVRNNIQNFGVEVLDEKIEVAIVYSVIHPDLGMIKRSIESNQQRKGTLVRIDELKSDPNKYNLFLLYQPNRDFNELFEELERDMKNYFLITGSQTDWNFLNEVQSDFSKETSGSNEDYFPSFQGDFNIFYTEDIGFESFPPLKGEFGIIDFKSSHEIMISQKINNVITGQPLLATYGNNDFKRVVLFGENIWKWRSQSFGLYESFEKFDIFFNSLIQFLQLSERNSEMDIYYKPVYHAQEPIKIQVKNYDSNLNIELNSRLTLSINDSSDKIPFYINNNYYEAQINSLETGTYRFEVKDLDSDKSKQGSFIVESFSLEEENTRPNIEDLKLLAKNSGGLLVYQDQFMELKTNLLNKPKFRSTQIERNKIISLIDWRWLLGLIVLSLSLEWLLRKYRGMI
ncbi:MAG: hypothetical protein GY908_04425 [Flavobacteriales bacterium]|nr:hypothetical protein [Flavobacteriales bacterium]